MKNRIINVQDVAISISKQELDDYICITDIAKAKSEHFKKQVGLLTFTPSISEWINKTNAIGLCVKRGKYGGTYAHKDIAFEL